MSRILTAFSDGCLTSSDDPLLPARRQGKIGDARLRHSSAHAISLLKALYMASESACQSTLSFRRNMMAYPFRDHSVSPARFAFSLSTSCISRIVTVSDQKQSRRWACHH
jgi:hypothetical protein